MAEGPKVVGDLLGHFTCRLIAGLPEWLALHPQTTARETLSVTPEELSQASFLQTPQDVIAIFEQPDYETDYTCPEHELCLALDGIQDPGNLGTIVRLADWFGIEHIYCSEDTVDIFNPKTVQATMGALARVRLHYLPLADFVKQIITVVAKAFDPASSEPADLSVVLPESLKKEVEPFLRKELAKALDAKVEARFSRKISGGFTIGPAGESWFISFTDETFRELISEYLRPATRKILFGE